LSMSDVLESGAKPPLPCPLLRLAKCDQRGESQLLGRIDEGVTRDKRCLELGHDAFGQLRKAAVYLVDDDEAQHGVSEELQALVVQFGRGLRGHAWVSQRAREEGAVGETVSDHTLGPKKGRIVVRAPGSHCRQLRAMMRVALCPPKPKELLMTASTRACRAMFAT
jgi:hypothetical protein